MRTPNGFDVDGKRRSRTRYAEEKPSTQIGANFPDDKRRRRGLIEKCRREAMNKYLEEFRALVPSLVKKNQSAKIEKADILRATINYLQLLRDKGLLIDLDNIPEGIKWSYRNGTFIRVPSTCNQTRSSSVGSRANWSSPTNTKVSQSTSQALTSASSQPSLNGNTIKGSIKSDFTSVNNQLKMTHYCQFPSSDLQLRFAQDSNPGSTAVCSTKDAKVESKNSKIGRSWTPVECQEAISFSRMSYLPNGQIPPTSPIKSDQFAKFAYDSSMSTSCGNYLNTLSPNTPSYNDVDGVGLDNNSNSFSVNGHVGYQGGIYRSQGPQHREDFQSTSSSSPPYPCTTPCSPPPPAYPPPAPTMTSDLPSISYSSTPSQASWLIARSASESVPAVEVTCRPTAYPYGRQLPNQSHFWTPPLVSSSDVHCYSHSWNGNVGVQPINYQGQNYFTSSFLIDTDFN